MQGSKLSRRDLLKTSSAILAAPLLSPAAVKAAAPPATAITPELIEVARKEGKVVYYTSVDLPLAERIAKSFEAKFPGISVRVERSGAERIFQRIGQEYSSRIHAVDVVNSSDASHFIVWRREGILAPFVPEDVARYYPDEHKDAEGLFASFRIGLSVIGYNTDLIKAADAPRSFADLLDARWSGKMVKAHPSYSGTILTATFQIVRDLGWDYLEKLARQRVMQVQSASDPPKKLVLGERAVMADGNEYNLLQFKEAGKPVEIVYPDQQPDGLGTLYIPNTIAILQGCPHPQQARQLADFLLSAEVESELSRGPSGQVPLHADAPGTGRIRSPSELRTMQVDFAAAGARWEEVARFLGDEFSAP